MIEKYISQDENTPINSFEVGMDYIKVSFRIKSELGFCKTYYYDNTNYSKEIVDKMKDLAKSGRGGLATFSAQNQF